MNTMNNINGIHWICHNTICDTIIKINIKYRDSSVSLPGKSLQWMLIRIVQLYSLEMNTRVFKKNTVYLIEHFIELNRKSSKRKMSKNTCKVKQLFTSPRKDWRSTNRIFNRHNSTHGANSEIAYIYYIMS